MAPSPPAAGLGYNVNACAVVEVDELELPESLGQLCLVGVLEEPELDLEVGVGEAFVAAKAWLTPSAPAMTPAASPARAPVRRRRAGGQRHLGGGVEARPERPRREQRPGRALERPEPGERAHALVRGAAHGAAPRRVGVGLQRRMGGGVEGTG